MAALGAQSIASSYEQLLHVDADGGGNGTTHVSVKDGDNGTTFGFTIASDALMMSSTNRLEFGDTGTYIHQSADGVLDLVSDTEIEINATTIDINGAVDISGATTLGSTVASQSNYLLEGYTTGRNVLRCSLFSITGETSETTFSVVMADVFNGEAIATESISQSSPTAGTRFNTDSGGLYVDTKTMTKTVVKVLASTVVNNDSGFDVVTDIGPSSGELRVRLRHAADGASVDLTNHSNDLPNGKSIVVQILYVTSD